MIHLVAIVVNEGAFMFKFGIFTVPIYPVQFVNVPVEIEMDFVREKDIDIIESIQHFFGICIDCNY